VLGRAIRRPHRGVGIPVVQFGWCHDVLLFEECMGDAAMIISFGNRIIAAPSDLLTLGDAGNVAARAFLQGDARGLRLADQAFVRIAGAIQCGQ
jgi:hypothetical protein